MTPQILCVGLGSWYKDIKLLECFQGMVKGLKDKT